ncbi:MAG: class I SAM-dependent methyltransferase [Candidatus Aenigmarchaeota archaeon]|nr:class I SAM-dependent methyltransferase [Candidatus Aenigmarchaeota archaeon]
MKYQFMNFKEHYDRVGKKEIKTINRTDRIRYETFAKMIKDGSSVLDIGSREGELKNFLGKKCKYIAADISKPRIDRLLKKGIQAYCFDICEQLPVELENKFDYVVLGEVIEHLTRPYDALLNIKKALNNKGILIGSTPNLYSLNRMLSRLIGMGPDNYNQEHIIAFDVVELKNMLKYAGFKVLMIKRSTLMYMPIDTFFGWHIFFKAQKY